MASYPAALTQASWDRQAGAVAQAKGVTLGAELKALEKSVGAIDFASVEPAKLAKVADVGACIVRLDGEIAKLVRTAVDQGRSVEAAAAKVEAQFRKDAAAKPALQAAAAVARASAEQRDTLKNQLAETRAAVMKRFEELKALVLKTNRKPSADQRQLGERIKAQFRVVKNRPDLEVEYLLCVGRESAAPFLGPSASDSHRPLLKRVLKDDSGLQFFHGKCIWEQGSVTFVGPRMSTTLARRIEDGIRDLIGTRLRVRARAGD
jgi:hypothetical protein